MVESQQTRVVRFCVDSASLTPEQRVLLKRHAGTARAVYNWALALRNDQEDARRRWLQERSLTEAGGDEAAAALRADHAWVKQVLTEAPDEIRTRLTGFTLGKAFTIESRTPGSRFAWWSEERHGVNRFAVSSALTALDAAFERYWRDTGGHRIARRSRPRKDGRPAGWPRFKKKGRCDDAFAIFNLGDAGRHPWSVIEAGHRIKVPSLGVLRVHENTRRLRRMIQRGGVPKSARFRRCGTRWYVTIVVSLPMSAVPAPVTTRPQRVAGVVGVDLGVKTLATLSNGETVPNARLGRAQEKRIRRLQRALARRQGPRRGRAPSRGWLAAKRDLGRAQHQLAVRRVSRMHELTKRLAAGFETVAIEDLNVRGMTATPLAVPDPERPGGFLANGRAAKSGLNRAILDVGFGEFRRQLAYKTSWYGSRVALVARFAPTSKTCSSCGAVKPKLRLAERVFHCEQCDFGPIDRDLNAARNIRDLVAECLSPSPADVGDAKRLGRKSRSGAPPPRLARQDPTSMVGPERPVMDLSSPSDR